MNLAYNFLLEPGTLDGHQDGVDDVVFVVSNSFQQAGDALVREGVLFIGQQPVHVLARKQARTYASISSIVRSV